MKITRDVIYDLLPGYFAEEVSADTRALIDEFLATDPEFARMTTRFRRLFEERASGAGDATLERDRFKRVRSLAEARQISAAFALAYTLAALFPLALDLLNRQAFRPVSLVLSTVFGAIAVGSMITWISARLRSV
jgi:hypothetical protein